ncbi:MAG: hypothetical protein MR579_00970 [Bacteroidales bacterium]|nr:hypothetical protein [Bacteroidales bacterium]
MEKKKRWQVPHTYVIVIAFVIFMALLTYVVPGGEYARVYDAAADRELVDPNSFTYVENQPVTLMQFLVSITQGMQQAGDVIFFVFIIGGAMEILNATGAINRSVASLSGKKYMQKAFVPIFALIFAIGGATFGVSDEIVIFAPIGITIAHALGYDALVGLATIALGAAVGFNAGFFNPFSTSIAQTIAELPIYSGLEYRLIIFAAMFLVTVWYIERYARRIKGKPENSYVANCPCETEKGDFNVAEIGHATGRDKLILLILFGGIGVMVYGVFNLGWYIDEMSGVFIAVGILAGFVGGMGPSKIAQVFVDGAASLTFGALVTGFAKAIVIVMEDGLIMDTIIHALGGIVTALPTSLAVLGMYLIQIVINFFIPSSTGQAAVVMPIMIPLADIANITRQTAVLAFQFGDGFSNSIIPTSSVLMSYLAVSRIPYEKWVKFIWPLMLIWIGMGAVFLIIANLMQYGPF